MTTQPLSRKQEILEKLRTLIMTLMPEDGDKESVIPGFFLGRRDHLSPSVHCLSIPKMALVVNGFKLLSLGRQDFMVKPGQSIVTCIDTPSASALVDISPANPFLVVYFTLNRKIIADLLSEMPHKTSISPSIQPPCVMDTPPDFLETFLRLTDLLAKPEEAPFLGALILRELHFMLLSGPYGGLLRYLYMHGSNDNRVIDIISWLKTHINESISVEELARMVHMSVSSLHRHFKSLTGYSPLQYQKRLRLYEAQRLMLAENERADIAAIAVGYESITQFNREYKRMFGEPPKRDINRRKGNFLRE